VNNLKNKNSTNANICKLLQGNGAGNIGELRSYSALK
jgi:hypothetical protein